MQTRTRRAATALLMGCVLGGGLAPPLGAHGGHDEAARARLPAWATTATVASTVAATTAAADPLGCASQVWCGFNCWAKLGAGYCITLINRTTPNIFGPKIKIHCKVCDCIYIAPGPNGRVLVRKVEFGCDSQVDGLEIY